MTLLQRLGLTIVLSVFCLACSQEEEIDIESLIGRCAECHTTRGQAAFPGWPAIAGMEKSEIIGKLEGHREGMVPDSTMSQVAFDMSDREIEAVAEYFSKLEPAEPKEPSQ